MKIEISKKSIIWYFINYRETTGSQNGFKEPVRLNSYISISSVAYMFSYSINKTISNAHLLVVSNDVDHMTFVITSIQLDSVPLVEIQ
jgi:hypothetical protein